MSDADRVDEPANWAGGFYELALEFEPSREAVFDAALRSLWAAPELDGCWARRSAIDEQPRLDGSLADHDASEHGHLYGRVTLPSGVRVVCGSLVIRLTDGPMVLLYLPLGALAASDARVGAYPFDLRDSLPWRRPIDAWLCAVAERVYRVAPFRCARIGMECSTDEALSVPETTIILPGPTGLSVRPATV